MGLLPFVMAAAAAGQAAADCVTIGNPKPALTFTYEHVESSGARSTYSDQWLLVTPVESRVRNTRGGTVTVQVNRFRVVDDAGVLVSTSKTSAGGAAIDSTSFSPGLVMDPVARACAGRVWNIASTEATYVSAQTSASARSPAGTLRIVAVREKITVPAGTFETVHYIRTSQSTDEYWKSREHGVIVKHIGKLPGYTVTETLQSIR
jgi:hypothetical protein